MNFDFFLSGEFYQMQAELEKQLASLGQTERLPDVARHSLIGLRGFVVKYNQADAYNTSYAPGSFDAHMRQRGDLPIYEHTFEHLGAAVKSFADATEYMEQYWIPSLTAAFEKFGMELNQTTPAERRQVRVSDWIYDSRLNDRLYDGRLWWLTYWPARAWEHVVLRLPTRWFARRSDEE
jgi:hypothetical protein